ncbi:MAG: hypothetical protein ABI453_15640, partial [Isosphaeraceae bacterium]
MMIFLHDWMQSPPPMVLALVLMTWSLTPHNAGVLDTSALSAASIATVTSTSPSSTDIPAFTRRPDRPAKRVGSGG